MRSLDGLSNVTAIGGMLWIRGNASLESLDGLSQITGVPGDLTINDNVALRDLDGLMKITAVAGDLRFEDNVGLESCAGLVPLLSFNNGTDNVDGAIFIGGNPEGCNSVTEILNASGIDGIEEVICSVESEVVLSDQAAVDQFGETYPSCNTLSDGLIVEGSDIINLDGLSGLVKVGGRSIC